MKESPVIYFDVDDTFVRSFGTKCIPMTGVIEKIRTLKIQGAKLYCWSSGGVYYVQNNAKEFEMKYNLDGFYPHCHA